MKPHSFDVEWTAHGGKLGPSGVPENNEVTPEMFEAAWCAIATSKWWHSELDEDIPNCCRAIYLAMTRARGGTT